MILGLLTASDTIQIKRPPVAKGRAGFHTLSSSKLDTSTFSSSFPLMKASNCSSFTMSWITPIISTSVSIWFREGLKSHFLGHVHDELIIECTPDVDLNVICKQMGRSPDWMPDILLRADGYDPMFYKKD